MKTALLQVKEELGVDAVIMSNKKVAGGVEIVAAVDNSDAAPVRQISRYDSHPRHPQQPATSGYAPRTNQSYSGRDSSRELADDRVQLSATKNAAPAEQPASMSKRFANLLKQYNSASEGNNDEDENVDSLSALLKRQSNVNSQSNSHSDTKQRLTSDRWKDAPKSKSVNTNRRAALNNSFDNDDISADEIEALREDVTSIRRLLEHQVSGLMWQEVERREPLRAMLIKRLARMGLSLDLADQLACYIPEETPPPKAWKALLRLVADQIPIAKHDLLKRGGVVALLGPTGVGKTTTVAKLAARAAMEFGSDNVALVTTDTFRIGAHEQLAIYGRIMGCPVKVAKDSSELADVIYQLRNRRLILVDTAGMGQRDVRLSEQLDTLMSESGEVIHSYLVLPATAQRKVLQETIDHFRRIPLSGCIMTKLDESLSLGEFVSVVIQNALPVAYIANGQRVPEDIVLAQPKYMVAKANELLEKSADNEPHYWSSDSDRL